MCMASFPPTPNGEHWHDHLMHIAYGEVHRLVYRRSVRLRWNEAIHTAVADTWERVSRLDPERHITWGFVRIVLRRCLITEYVIKPLRVQRGGRAQHVGLSMRDPKANQDDNRRGSTDEKARSHPNLLTNPWPDVENKIGFDTLLEAYARDVESRRTHTRKVRKGKVSRQRTHQQRVEFLEFVNNNKREHD